MQSVVTSLRSASYELTPKYLFDHLLSVPSKQGSKTAIVAEIKPEFDALNRIHCMLRHCPAIVPLLDYCESGDGRCSKSCPTMDLLSRS